MVDIQRKQNVSLLHKYISNCNVDFGHTTLHIAGHDVGRAWDFVLDIVRHHNLESLGITPTRSLNFPGKTPGMRFHFSGFIVTTCMSRGRRECEVQTYYRTDCHIPLGRQIIRDIAVLVSGARYSVLNKANVVLDTAKAPWLGRC